MAFAFFKNSFYFQVYSITQVHGGQSIGIRTKNDPETFIQIIHPNELILTIFDLFPYKVQDPIVVGPQSAITYMLLELHANKEDWNLESELAGNQQAVWVLFFLMIN